MPKQYSIEEMQKQIHQLQTTINLPGVPDDEKQIYTATIQRISAEIAARQAKPVTPEPPKQTLQPIKTITPPPPPPSKWPPVSETMEENAERELQRAAKNSSNPDSTPSRHIHAGNQHPVHSQQPMSATIQADHHTNPHNPTVTITWADGYTYTGDETAIRGRFTTTLRDTLALRLVQQGRFNAMWRWSSPWRAAGFYQALTYLIGAAPTIHELGISRPSELTRTVFQLIAETAACTPLTE